jgi:hypothetical protein
MESKIVISAVNIRKEYVTKRHFMTGKVKEKYVAVKLASFDIEEGKTVGIVGEGFRNLHSVMSFITAKISRTCPMKNTGTTGKASSLFFKTLRGLWTPTIKSPIS